MADGEEKKKKENSSSKTEVANLPKTSRGSREEQRVAGSGG